MEPLRSAIAGVRRRGCPGRLAARALLGAAALTGMLVETVTVAPTSAAATTTAGVAGTATPPNSVTADSPYPVLFSIAADGAAPLTDPTAAPAGANNWSCHPSAAHPHPVVLVHGLLATMAENWGTMAPLLADNGYCVFALTYGLDPGEPYAGGLTAMEQSAPQLAAFVDRVLAATGARQVDLVGHSEGTVMPQYYLKFLGGASKVHRYVAIAPLYHGTTLDGVANLAAAFPQGATAVEQLLAAGICGSCGELLTGSPFLTHLYADGVYAVPGITYTTIMTRYDEAVTPYTSGYLHAPNATNIVVQDQCPLDYSEHATLAFDPVVGQDILNALDPAEQQPVPCTLVLPAVGAPWFR